MYIPITPVSFHGRVSPGLRRSLRQGLAAALERLLFWQERHAEAFRLRELDDYLLHDIGLSRDEAERGSRVISKRRG